MFKCQERKESEKESEKKPPVKENQKSVVFQMPGQENISRKREIYLVL
jgi:hypothetical protein